MTMKASTSDPQCRAGPTKLYPHEQRERAHLENSSPRIFHDGEIGNRNEERREGVIESGRIENSYKKNGSSNYMHHGGAYIQHVPHMQPSNFPPRNRQYRDVGKQVSPHEFKNIQGISGISAKYQRWTPNEVSNANPI